MKKNGNSSTIIWVGVAVVILVGAGYLLTRGTYSPNPATTTVLFNNSLTTITINQVTTTVVPNQTVATGPNLASCNGYNYTISSPFYSYVVSCNWQASKGQPFMNVTIWSGSYNNVMLTLVQQNVTTSPYNRTFVASPCNQASASGLYVPAGNYKVTFSVGSPSLCTPSGPATVRLSH